MKTIYLSGGIKDFKYYEQHEWRNFAKDKLCHICIDPTTYEGETTEELVELDKSYIDKSDALLVFFIRPSVGTSMEILYAYERNIPVYVVNEANRDLSPWMIYHAKKIFNTLKEACECLNSSSFWA
jgi:nucleoside 2-deoxyribosyltransferase